VSVKAVHNVGSILAYAAKLFFGQVKKGVNGNSFITKHSISKSSFMSFIRCKTSCLCKKFDKFIRIKLLIFSANEVELSSVEIKWLILWT
jgi:hypothetical protein